MPKFYDIKPRKKTVEGKKDGNFYQGEENQIFSELIASARLEKAHQKFINSIDDKVDDLKNARGRYGKNAKSLFINIGTSLSRTRRMSRPNNRRKINTTQLAKLVLISMFSVAFVGFLFIKVNAVKAQINSLTKESEQHIDQAYEKIDSGDISGALAEADFAGKNIKRIKLLAQAWGQDFTYLKSSPYADSKLTASERLLDASYLIVNTISSVNFEFTKLAPDDSDSTGLDKSSKFVFNIEDKQIVLLSAIESSKNNLTKSKNDLQEIKKGRAAESYQNKIDSAIAAIDKTFYSLDSTQTLVKSDIPWLSGMDGKPKDIMILFQNNAELRGASGGSLGSFGVAHFVDGNMVGIDFGKNIFTLDQAFEATGQHIDTPEIIKFLRGERTWTLKDSGWSVDGPEAFSNILKFYKTETGQQLDGAIMLDTTTITALLSELGPIEMPEYGTTISAENFRAVLEEEVHKDYFVRPGGKEENQPKKIIADMMPKFLGKIFDGLGDKKQSAKILASLAKSLKQKDLVFYFEKADFQERMENLGYAGKIIPAMGDYIHVNNSNIAGEKSSINMSESLSLKTTINSDGKIANSLEIKRKHNGNGVWPDGINKNFVRFLVPENSKITNFNPQAGNFQQFFDQELKDGKYFWLDQASGKTEVNFWMTTNPGEESSAMIDYEPAYSVKTNEDFTYIISLQKQPGANPDQASLLISYPANFIPVNVKNYDQENSKVSLNILLDHDQTIKIRFKKIK